MSKLTKNQLVASLARDLVVEVAPQEAPLFRAHSEAYFKDPDKALKMQEGKEELLGFGTGAEAIFITPSILALSTVVVNFVVTTVGKSVREEAADYIGESVQGVFRKLRSDDAQEEKKEQLSLTAEQLMKLRELVFEQASHLRLSDRTAATLADSLIGRVAVSS